MTKGWQRSRPLAQPDAKNDRLPSPEALERARAENELLSTPKKKSGRGHLPIGAMPARTVLQRLYSQEGKTIREIAAALGCSKDMVHRALREYGIEARPVARRSRLQKIPLAKIEAEVRALGLRGAARALGVDHSTLAQHLRARRE